MERPVAAGLLALPLLYVTALTLPAFPSGQAWVPAGFAVTLLIALLSGLPTVSGRDLAAWVGIALSLFFALTVYEPGTFVDAPAALASGVLIGLPWVAWTYIWRAREPLANRLFAYAFALEFGVLLLTTLETLNLAGTPVSADAFVSGFYSVNLEQAQGISTLLAAAGTASLPAHNFFDATFAALVGVSALGVILLVLRPRTGDDRPLPVSFALRAEEAAGGDLTPLMGFSEAQRVAFRARSLPEPPGSAAPPGFVAVLVAALATCGFLGAAFLLPYWALLGGTAGLAAGAGLLALLTDLRYRTEVELARPASGSRSSPATRPPSPVEPTRGSPSGPPSSAGSAPPA